MRRLTPIVFLISSLLLGVLLPSLPGDQPRAAAAINTQTYSRSPGLSIPDNASPGVTDVLSIPDSGAVQKVTVDLTITHPWIGDLIVNLRHVNTGNTVTLINRIGGGGCGENNLAIRLDDAEAVKADSYLCPGGSSGGPMTGTWAPTLSLSSLNGIDLNGDWTLTVSDNQLFDSGGVLVSWALNITYDDGLPVDGPPGSPVVFTFDDDRLNHHPWAPVVLYCRSGDLHIYGVNPASGAGYLLYEVEHGRLNTLPERLSVIFTGENGLSLHKAPAGWLLLNAYQPDGKLYQFQFSPCE